MGVSTLGKLLVDEGDCSGNKPPVCKALRATKHRIGLAGTGLSVGKDGAIVPIQAIEYCAPGHRVKDLLLASSLLQDAVKLEAVQFLLVVDEPERVKFPLKFLIINGHIAGDRPHQHRTRTVCHSLESLPSASDG